MNRDLIGDWLVKLHSILSIPIFILALICGIIIVGETIDLLQQYIGFFAYFLWIFILPITGFTIFFLPWFSAWVQGSEVNPTVFWIWAFLLIFGGIDQAVKMVIISIAERSDT